MRANSPRQADGSGVRRAPALQPTAPASYPACGLPVGCQSEVARRGQCPLPSVQCPVPATHCIEHQPVSSPLPSVPPFLHTPSQHRPPNSNSTPISHCFRLSQFSSTSTFARIRFSNRRRNDATIRTNPPFPPRTLRFVSRPHDSLAVDRIVRLVESPSPAADSQAVAGPLLFAPRCRLTPSILPELLPFPSR